MTVRDTVFLTFPPGCHVGHAERWDEATLDGKLDAVTQDCTIRYRRGNKTLAVAVVHRDSEGLNAEVAFELTR